MNKTPVADSSIHERSLGSSIQYSTRLSTAKSESLISTNLISAKNISKKITKKKKRIVPLKVKSAKSSLSKKSAKSKRKSSGADTYSSEDIFNWQKRETYGSHKDFLFSVIGCVVGYGNIWRFPDLVFKNGGGAFLIPYGVSLLLFGLPMVSLELYLGQLGNVGVGMIFGLIVPIFQGIGIGMVVSCIFISFRYNILIAYSILYFVMSFNSTLTWSTCRNDYNTNFCRSELDDIYCRELLDNINATFINGNCTTQTYIDNFSKQKFKSSTEEFFTLFVLPTNDSVPLSWKLSLSLLAAWILTFLCLCRGVRFSGRLSFFTLPFFTVVFGVLFIASISQDGAVEGVKFYVVPNLDELGDINVWSRAITQVLWSLDISTGVLTNTASYNTCYQNSQRDAPLIVLVDTLFSFFVGLTIFAAMGNLAKTRGVDINEVLKSDYDIAFILYPQTLSQIPIGPFWSILFFASLILVGVSTQIWVVQIILTEMSDIYFQFREGKWRIILLGVVCITCFIIGLAFCTKDGMKMLITLDDHATGWPIALLAFLEIISISYIYGINRFAKDVSLILGYTASKYWIITWSVFTPICVFALLLILLHEPFLVFQHEPDDTSPEAESLGWLIACVPVCCVQVFALYQIIENRRRHRPFKSLFLPNRKWCPRKKADNEAMKKEIAAAEQGQMGEFELSPRSSLQLMFEPKM